MVTQVDRIPDLVPVPPEWLNRQRGASGLTGGNANINDVYWQKPDGWIIVGPSAETGANGRPLTAQAEGLIRRGWKPLVEYSYTDRVNSKTGHRETIELNADHLNTPDRYYWLFANGGARLFTIEQIVEHHWHLHPPFGMAKSVFPQLLEWEVPEAYWCPACPPGRPAKNSEEQVVTHLMVEHRMTLVQTRDLQESTNGFLDHARGASGLAIRRKAQQQEAAVTKREDIPSPDQPKARMVICNVCGESFPDGLAKYRHAKKEHPESSSDEASPS